MPVLDASKLAIYIHVQPEWNTAIILNRLTHLVEVTKNKLQLVFGDYMNF